MGVWPMSDRRAWARRPCYVVMRTRIILLLLAAFLTGCNGRGAQSGRQPYTGPTLPMYEVVGRINANNAKVTSLWATQEMDAGIVDDKGKRDNYVLSGNLLFRPERDMLLLATKTGVGRVFELGSNSEVYWMSVRVGPDTAWWGRYRHLGKPCAQPIPIRPDLIIQVLGVSTIN